MNFKKNQEIDKNIAQIIEKAQNQSYEQGKTDLRIVEGPGIFIGTVEKEAKKDKESKEDKDAQKEDDDKIK